MPGEAASGSLFRAGDSARLLWESAFPAVLQDPQGRIIDANPAYVRYTGRALEALIGLDPIELQPAEDREINRAAREALADALRRCEVPTLAEQRLLDAQGKERWFRASAALLSVNDGRDVVLTVLQDATAEQAARMQAERSLDELSQWFELSPSGMLVFDEGGLIVRSNSAFEALVERVPVLLADAGEPLQRLLGWQGDATLEALQLGKPVLETQAELPLPEGRTRRLRARVRAFATGDGQRRFMAMVEDRSMEDERDLAQLEMGALLEVAGIGVATLDSQRGWRRSELPARRGEDMPADGAATAPPAGSAAALQAINREVVEPGSRADYERLQRALRHGERAQVRYAVRLPDLGLRWLLTRVEPTELGEGRRATSVVTLDVTEQELAQRKSDELLRELTTILDGSPAGIAYLRDGRLVRCNRRFERMLGFAPGAVAGADFEELFRHRCAGAAAVQEAALALADGKPCDVELDAGAPLGEPVWYSLSVRRAEPAHAGAEAVAVLADISHLKRQQSELEVLLRERDLMFSLSDVGIAWLRGSKVVRANAALAELTGLAPVELGSLDVAELYEDKTAAQAFEAQARRNLLTHGRFAGERRLRRRDGSLRWVQVSMRPVDADDPQSDVVCSFVDVDERQRARESLQLLAARTRSVLDSVLVGIVTVGDNGIEWMNRSARRMFAGELNDFAGEPIATVATASPGHPLRRTDWLIRLADGQAETFECRLKARDGREFWVVGNAVATTRDSAVGRQVTFALLDIESRRQAEMRVTQAQASLQRVIETAPMAIALFDTATQRVLQINQTAAVFFGHQDVAPEALIGLEPAQIFDADEAAALRASLALAGDSAEGVRREILRPGAVDAAGAATPQRWDARFVHLPSGEPGTADRGQVLLVASDVTEQRVAEQARLDAAIAQREMLVNEVHHRIKNNLQGVAGLLQQMAARRPEVRTELNEAVAQVQAIAQVHGLQVGAGAPLALAGVLRAIAGSVQRTFGHPIEVSVMDAGVQWLLPEAESIPLALTLNELLTNAVKHGDASDVVCTMQATRDGAVIEIVNGGRLSEGFDLERTPAGMFGLGLVRALLPRRHAALAFEQRGERVCARVELHAQALRSAQD
jgi:PAS domain S-box-containing protein